MLTGPMAAQDLARRLLAPVTLAVVVAALPSGATAVDRIPAEPGVETLPGTAITAISVDMDGDGARELVRLTPRADNPGLVAVDAWSFGATGAVSLGSLPVRRTAGVDEQLGGRPPADANGMLPLRVDDPGRLVAWRVAGREQALLLAIGVQDNPRPCCLTAWQLVLGAGRLELRQLDGVAGSADWVRVADLDGDGTDELVVSEPADAGRPDAIPITIFRWNGERFDAVRGSLEPARSAPLLQLGDSDGRPGQEVGLLAVSQGTPAVTLLHRISLESGGVRLESGPLPSLGQVTAMPGPDGGRLVLATPGAGLTLLDWPAGAPSPSAEAESVRSGIPLTVLGTGDDARLLLLREATLDVLDAGLRSRQGVVEEPNASAFRGSQLLPYVGPLPGGLPGGEQAFIFRGRMLAPLPPPSPHRLSLLVERPTSALPGSAPIGVLGTGGMLGIAADTGFDAGRDGGQLSAALGPQRGVAISVGPADLVLGVEEDEGRLAVRFGGATLTTRAGSDAIVTAGDFSVTLRGPAGSRVELRLGEDRAAETQIGPAGELDLQVRPAVEPDAESTFTLRVLAVTPGGHGYAGAWPTRVLRKPPALQAQAAAPIMAFEVRVSGRTTPGAAVTVDGAPASVAPDGTFSAVVGAGILPRDVVVAATDIVGNRRELELSVVGPFDYRLLPWIPIVVGLTLLAGVVLFLRVPRPVPPSAGEGDAGLEEID